MFEGGATGPKWFACFSADSMAMAVSRAFFQVSSVSVSSLFWICLFRNPQTNLSLNACSRNPPNSQRSEHCFSAAA